MFYPRVKSQIPLSGVQENNLLSPAAISSLKETEKKLAAPMNSDSQSLQIKIKHIWCKIHKGKNSCLLFKGQTFTFGAASLSNILMHGVKLVFGIFEANKRSLN